MKLLPIALLLLCASCARFSTTQTDISYGTNGPSRAITTKAQTTTFFSAKSDLSKFKASQTDKTQTATVGSVNLQSTEPTNTVNVLSDTAIKLILAK